MLNSTTIFDIKLTTSTKKDILENVEEYLMQKNSSKLLTIFSINPEITVEANSNPDFLQILNKADINLPDGEGIVWAVNKLSAVRQTSFQTEKMSDKMERISGIDLMSDLIKIAAGKKYSIALIGGRNGVAGKTLENLQKKYPGLTGWTEEVPKFKFNVQCSKFKVDGKDVIARSPKDDEACLRSQAIFLFNDSQIKIEEYLEKLAKRIKDSGVKLVFIGLGAPKQEYFIQKLSSMFLPAQAGKDQSSKNLVQRKKTSNFELSTSNSLVLMSVGGAFDILSGRLTRAPIIIQKLNLEWLWRLILEPKRFFRQLKLIKFVWMVVKR